MSRSVPRSIDTRHSGDGHSQSEAAPRHCTAGLPQCGQNFASWNIIPKQAGQAMLARRAPQCWQFGASLDAAAPQLWQFNVRAFMGRRMTDRAAAGDSKLEAFFNSSASACCR
jgi:hypothetical protein